MLLVISSCENDTNLMRLLVYDQEQDSYSFKEVELTTLNNVQTLEGEATKLKGGASMTINYETGYLKWHSLGTSVAFSAIEGEGGVLIPEDYHSLAMASTYYNFELSRLFFLELGIPEAMLDRLTTYYWANITFVEETGEKLNETDNAFFINIPGDMRAFFIMPFSIFQWIPMPLNSGIITHEYTHMVFDRLFPESSTNLSDSGNNFLLAINEGTADYMAVARTGDPDFMEHSVAYNTFKTESCSGLQGIELVRNASDLIVYTSELEFEALNRDYMEFVACRYEIGAFWSAMMYEIARKLDSSGASIPDKQFRALVAKWLLGSLLDLSKTIEHDFDIVDAVNLFVARIKGPSDRKTACSVIEKRFSYRFSEVEGC
jgi:hypothetical protein